MDIIFVIISACITIFSIGLLTISLTSYRKYHTGKLLVISLVFIVFLLQGLLLSLSLFFPKIVSVPLVFFSFLDLIVLVLLFIATLKR
jgi:hypothetical protein